MTRKSGSSVRVIVPGLLAVLLFVLMGCGSTTVTTSPSAELAEIQRKLETVGYDPGPADGLMGERTKKAIQHFQIDADLRPDGRVTPELKEKLTATHKQHVAAAQVRQAKERKKAQAAAVLKEGAARIPLYEIGDSFIWSDGISETVSRIGGGLIQFDASDGSEHTQQIHFVAPPQSWASGGTVGRTELNKSVDESWPLSGARETLFSAKAIVQSPGAPISDEWSGDWRCVPKGREKVPVPAGVFDAYVIDCERSDPPAGTWKRRTWHYVPEINHYVRFLEVLHPSKNRRGKELVAARPGNEGWPAAALAGLDGAIQQALARKPGSAPVEWSSSAVGGNFKIVTTGQRRLSGGVRCRTYLVSREGLGPIRHYPGIACRRGKTGRWLVPGLDDGALKPEQLYRK